MATGEILACAPRHSPPSTVQPTRMLPAETHLEVRSRVPPRSGTRGNGRTRRPPLLFVHGGYTDGWCWEPHFLPWFAAQGYEAHALSLRGHGASGGRESLFIAGLDDYAADVERVAAQFPVAPVLIGHSMGAAVVERLLATRPLRAAALVAPVPPTGLLTMAARLAAEEPNYLMHIGHLDPSRISGRVLRTLQPFYFSDDVAPEILSEAARHLGTESPRALFDLSLRLHWQLPERSGVPVFVMGAEGDRICTPSEVGATARHHGVAPVIVPDLAHMMMLERQWERSARPLRAWLETL
jgi:pimeloyl-ACP methyl ester carboxylesterase